MTDVLTAMTMYEICLLHSKSDRLLRLVVSRELEPFGITMMQWLLLVTVNKGPNSGMRMTELSEQLDVTMPQITALMNDLVELKLAKQKINSSDRRSRRLSVTTAGKKRLDEIDESIDKALKNWLRAIPADDIDGYFETLKLMAQMDVDGNSTS
jgi:DNA-binding MarR family transcriptional regulator